MITPTDLVPVDAPETLAAARAIAGRILTRILLNAGTERLPARAPRTRWEDGGARVVLDGDTLTIARGAWSRTATIRGGERIGSVL